MTKLERAVKFIYEDMKKNNERFPEIELTPKMRAVCSYLHDMLNHDLNSVQPTHKSVFVCNMYDFLVSLMYMSKVEDEYSFAVFQRKISTLEDVRELEYLDEARFKEIVEAFGGEINGNDTKEFSDAFRHLNNESFYNTLAECLCLHKHIKTGINISARMESSSDPFVATHGQAILRLMWLNQLLGQ